MKLKAPVKTFVKKYTYNGTSSNTYVDETVTIAKPSDLPENWKNINYIYSFNFATWNSHVFKGNKSINPDSESNICVYKQDVKDVSGIAIQEYHIDYVSIDYDKKTGFSISVMFDQHSSDAANAENIELYIEYQVE